MALQVKRAGPEDFGTWVKMLIAGDPGAGKTRSASTWPGVFYANAEGGQLSVRDRRPPSIDIDSTAKLTELYQALTQKPEVRTSLLGTDVQTVVIDTVDEVARIMIRERLQSERKESMAIQDWGWLGDRLRDLVRGWRNLDLNVLFLVHTKSQEDSETGRVVYKPAIQGAMGDEIAAYVDLAVLLRARPTATVVKGENVRVIQRFMQTFPDIQHPWVKDRSGTLPMEFPINMDDDYARLYKLIFGSVMAPERPPQTQPGGPRKPPPPPVQAPVRGPDGPEPEAKAAPEAPPEPAAAAPIPESAPLAQPTPEQVEADPAVPTPTPEPTPPPPEPEPEPAPAVEPAPATTPPVDASSNGKLEDWQVCENCGNEIETKDHGDLSFIRFKARLCRSCFAERKKAKV